MNRLNNLFLACACMLATAAFAVNAQDQEMTQDPTPAADQKMMPASPKQVVEKDITAVINILRDKGIDKDARWQEIAKIMYGRFDFRSMSQSVLADNWKRASPEEKEQFIDYFSKYLENVYREKIEKYTDQKVEYITETMAESRAVVDTVIVTSNTRIPVTYKLKDNDGDWFIYDVVIEGLSLVANYRDTYGDKIKNEGMDGLLADMRSQIEEYRAEYLLQRQAEETSK